MQSEHSTSRAENPRPQQPQRGNTRPVESGKDAIRAVSDMENYLLTLKDLGWSVVMTAQSETGMEEHYASALCRLGTLIVDWSEAAEVRRQEAMDIVHAERGV